MKTRFVINVSSSLRTIFSVRETGSGDLNIHITSGGRSYSAPTIGELIAVSDESAFEECDKHISIHLSPKLDTQNVIKRTHEYPNRNELPKEIGYHYTTGIKQENLFVPVLFRISADLSRQRFAIPTECEDSLIQLGQYDPSSGQLRLMIIVSAPDTPFPQHIDHPSHFLEHRFSKFRLTVLWSFIGLPSHPQAIDIFLETTKESGSMRGLNWQEIYDLYTELNMKHAQAYIKLSGFK